MADDRRLRRGPFLTILAVLFALTACGDDAPTHYYVLCEGKDANGWTLIDSEKDDNGYLIACTYQSPDRKQVVTDRCTAEGCD